MRLSSLLTASGVALLLLGSATPPEPLSAARTARANRGAAAAAPARPVADAMAHARRTFVRAAEAATIAEAARIVAAEPLPPPTPRQALRDGVLIVVSLASQQLFVFRNGALWGSSQVSTGRRGFATPTGTFPILQKNVRHYSNLYDGAPMPYMQRLTWGGVALHAGRVPDYPASHGCIRLPTDFAQDLYRITGFSSTIVVITGAPVTSSEQALTIA
ncbi:MAG TPA: L,D-transpeptidase family protein [Allosphingosinicella sp.]